MILLISPSTHPTCFRCIVTRLQVANIQHPFPPCSNIGIQWSGKHAVARHAFKEQDEHEEEEAGERIALIVESGDRLPYLNEIGKRGIDEHCRI